MKYLSLLLAGLFALSAQAQYRGGDNDGVASQLISTQNPLPTIYRGGGDDGHSSQLVSNQNPVPGIYLGGNNDGHASLLIANQNPLPAIYSGGSNDGFSAQMALALNALPQIYTGGSNDGVATLLVSNQNPLPAIYTGGSNDGISSAQASTRNPLPEIYRGGANDGWSFELGGPQNPTIPLPTQILEFSAAWFHEDAVLSWKAEQQQELGYFELERSEDGGRSFAYFARIDRPADPAQRDFRHSDIRAWYLPPEHLFYRLKTVAKDGSYHYSATVRLSKDRTQPLIAVFPNPTSGRFTLSLLNEQHPSDYSYQLSTGDGKLLRAGRLAEIHTAFDLSGLPAAVYQLSLFRGGQLIQHFRISLLP